MINKSIKTNQFLKDRGKKFSIKKQGKKKISFISTFISSLFLNKYSTLSNLDLSKETMVYDIIKKGIFKRLLRILLNRKNDVYKVLELFVISKKLTIKKKLAQFLSYLVANKICTNSMWKIAIILEGGNAAKNFSLDYLILYGISSLSFVNFFLKEYIVLKQLTYKKMTFYLHERSPLNLNLKYLGKVLATICVNFSRTNSYDLLIQILNHLGKFIWGYSHLIVPLIELINFLKYKYSFLFSKWNLFNTILIPKFPISNSFCLLSLINEFQLSYYYYLVPLYMSCRLKKKKIRFQKYIYSSTDKIITPRVIYFSLKKFYLYT